MAYGSGDPPGTFESGRRAGCGVLPDDAGIVMEEPVDDYWVRKAYGRGSRNAAESATCR
jgi:hypothetical protein